MERHKVRVTVDVYSCCQQSAVLEVVKALDAARLKYRLDGMLGAGRKK